MTRLIGAAVGVTEPAAAADGLAAVASGRHSTNDRASERSAPPGDQAKPFSGPAAQLLATEHWSLLAHRSMMWSEAMSRAAVFLTVLSASIIALALTGDATGFGSAFTLFALLLLPAVLLLGTATYLRLVQINNHDVFLVSAMNRLRRGYLDMAPELAPYVTTGAYDDERGLTLSYGLGLPVRASPLNFLLTTPTIVMTIDAGLVAALIAFAGVRFGAAQTTVVVGASLAFVAAWGGLFWVQLRSFLVLRRSYRPRFPTPETGEGAPDGSGAIT